MHQNYKRIAKNTIFLYLRMLVLMMVSLYTVRIVLEALGVTDFGIYSVVGSIVIMFNFLNDSLSSATQRFLAFEIGRDCYPDISKVFSAAIIIHAIIALVVLILAETLGLWFLHNKMNIPIERISAAGWVYHLSVCASIVAILQVPYNALIIAHEKMNFYAYLSILEALLKLAAVYILLIISFDKLTTYSAFVLVIAIFVILTYYVYCKKNFPAVRFGLISNKSIFKKMLSFSGWSLIGSFSWVMMNHGVNIMLNVFFGPTVNAARGISMQVNTAVMSLIMNFRTAVNPQIIKMHSAENNDEMKYLTLTSARYTFYLSLLLILPVFFETEKILSIWLTSIPAFTVIFCRLILLFSLIQTFDMSFGIVFQSLGKIKENQLLGGLTYLSVVPISYLMITGYDSSPIIVYYVQIFAVFVVAFIVKIYLLNKLTNIKCKDYLVTFLFPVAKVTCAVILLAFLLKNMNLSFFPNIFGCLVITTIIVFTIDLSADIKRKLLRMALSRP